MDPAALFQDTEPDQLNCHKLVIMYLVNTAGLCSMYVKTDLWKHQKTCPLNENVHDKAKRNEPIKNGKLLLPLKVKSRDLYANILLHMVDDEVRYTIESDSLLTAYGAV